MSVWTDCTGQQGAEAMTYSPDGYWPAMANITVDDGTYTSDDLRGLAAWLVTVAESVDALMPPVVPLVADRAEEEAE